ncbi:discoidin domain-containing protein [Acetobacter tropicalis]|nr:discoidin domain-containing protein [Acetobacter tropicalis]
MKNPEVVIAFRTHIWNPEIEHIARKLIGCCGRGKFVIIADETNSVLDTGYLPKISHTSSFENFKILSEPPHNTLWYNADYPLYTLRQKHPEASHIIMIENDVSINFSLDNIIDTLIEQKIDLIVHEFQDAPNNWPWTHTLIPWFAHPKKCLLPFLAISARGIDSLLKKKQIISQKFLSLENEKPYPYCEGFIPSTIYEEEYKIVELNNFASTTYYHFDNAQYYLSLDANLPGSIAHPVVGHTFVKRRLHRDGIQSLFDKQSSLRKALPNIPPREFYHLMLQEAQKSGNLDVCHKLNDLALEENWILKPEAINYAIGGTATQSSTSEWSKSQDITEDASFAINGIVGSDYGFHTDHEENPWWLLTLQDPIHINHIIIYNRMNFRERASKIKIEISTDCNKWLTIASYSHGILFGGADGHPLVLNVDNIFAQFVKISLLEPGVLHLNQVEVYSQ